MSDFGENLRQERVARGVSLDDISAVTKISVRLLRAIENEEFDRLPGGVFNVNFVRQYARYLKLDEERVVAEFRQLAAPPVELSAAQQPTLIASEWKASRPPAYGWEHQNQSGLWKLATLVVIGSGLGIFLWMARSKSVHPVPAKECRVDERVLVVLLIRDVGIGAGLDSDPDGVGALRERGARHSRHHEHRDAQHGGAGSLRALPPTRGPRARARLRLGEDDHRRRPPHQCRDAPSGHRGVRRLATSRLSGGSAR